MPYRRTPARRSELGQQQCDPQRRVHRHHVARSGSDPERSRSARCLGLHRAYLRCVYRYACADFGARGGRCAGDPDSRERQHHPQPDAVEPVRARSPGALLPPACAGLGGRSVRTQGRSEEDFRAGAKHFQLAAVFARLFPRRAEPFEEIRRIRPARPVQQRLLGQPGVQAAAGSQPDGGDALPRSAGFPEGDRQGPHHLRRQEPAPELAGGRRAVRDQPERRRCRGCDQHGAPEPGQEHHRPQQGIRGEGLHPRPAGHRFLLQGLGLRRRSVVQEHHVLRRYPATRQ